MEKIVFTTLSRQDLEVLVIDCVKTVIENNQPFSPKSAKPEAGQPESQFLTKKQAARLLNCSPSTIDNAARAGKLQRHYLGKTVRFLRDEVLGLAEPEAAK